MTHRASGLVVMCCLCVVGMVVPAGCTDSGQCQPEEGPSRSVTLGEGTTTVTVDEDKVFSVIIRGTSMGRPSVLRGRSILDGPEGPFSTVGGGTQFNFTPKRTGTAAIIAYPKAVGGTPARLAVQVVCPS